MRFVSRYGGFGVQIRPQYVEAYATGGARVVQVGVHAYFKVEEARAVEIDLAKQYWTTWNGSFQQEDEVTTVPPDYRIGAFDSEQAQIDAGWTDETREEVERYLIDHAARFNDILVIPATLVPAPWPRYDEYTGSTKALVRKLVDEGHNLDEVLEYERATQRRDDLILALEELISDTDAQAEMRGEALEEVAG